MTQYLVFTILLVTLVLFIWGRWRYDVVAALSLMATVLTGAIPYSHTFSGFSNPAVITVAMVMIITRAVTYSGIIDSMVDRISPAISTQWTHIALLTAISAVLSGFMNNVGALALLMPIAVRTAVQNKRSPSLLLMPIAFGSILGGMATLIGTPPNIIISSYRQEALGQPFAMFDFAPVGATVAVLGIIYIVVIGWRLIPKARFNQKAAEDIFHIQDYVTEVRILEESPMVGKEFHELDKLIEADYLILGLVRGNRRRLTVPRTLILKEDDIIIIEASSKDLEKITAEGKFELVGSKGISTEQLKSENVDLIEVVVVPGSKVEGRTPQRIGLRSRYGINLLAISRQGETVDQRLKNVRLSAGDVLLLQGAAETLVETIAEIGFLPLAGREIRLGSSKGAWLPLIIFGIALALTASSVLPVQIAFAGAVLAMIMFNVIPVRKVYDSVDWSVIVLLGAMIPVGNALETTGGTKLIAGLIIQMAGQMHPVFILGILMVVTMCLSDLMNNAATAVVMSPIAMSIAHKLGYNVDPFLMTIAVGASCAFLTPIGHQSNTLVMGPGGYHFGDYWRMGLILELLILFSSLPLIVFFWPFQ